LLLLATLTTEMTAVVVADTFGAVNNPEELMVPALVYQETAWLEELATVEVNCCVPPELTVALCGEIEMVTGAAMVNVLSAPTTSIPPESRPRTRK
jgi:hypothetical protein